MSISTPVYTTAASQVAPQKKSLTGYRWMVFYRFALALLGGYALASLSAILIAQSFSEHGASAALSATLIAFALHSGVFIWVFMVNTTLKASLGVFLPCLMMYVFYRLMGY